MKKLSVEHSSESAKVISLDFDANFYFKRAVQSLERRHYDKALKYFQQSIDKDPTNPIHHCNLAGLLSELGRFDESNEILQKVLDQIDAELYECYFFMANNYAHLGLFEEAEHALLEYLRLDPEGEYMEEVDEMLQLVSYELGRPTKELSPSMPEYIKEHDVARAELKTGQFEEAAVRLEKIVAQHPEFLPAYNNLCVAYTYLEQIDDAIAVTEHVLEQEPANIHALCNLAMLAHDQQYELFKETLIEGLKKLVPLHIDHIYKIATTMGILDEHEAAYERFLQLKRLGMEPDPDFYHCLAVSACNTGRLDQARVYWKKVAHLDPQSGIAPFYIEQVDYWLAHPEEEVPLVSYVYQLPFEEQLVYSEFGAENPQGYSLSSLHTDPLVHASFSWVLKQDDESMKRQVIQLLGLIGDEVSERLLRQYLLRPTDEDECKTLALLVLRQMSAKPPYTVWIEQHLEVLDPRKDEKKKLVINHQWNEILDYCQQRMTEYTRQQKEDMKTLWFEFIYQQGTPLPEVRRVEAWAAAFEFVIAKHHELPFSQAQIANKYRASPSTVARHVKQLSSIKGIFTN